MLNNSCGSVHLVQLVHYAYKVEVSSIEGNVKHGYPIVQFAIRRWKSQCAHDEILIRTKAIGAANGEIRKFPNRPIKTGSAIINMRIECTYLATNFGNLRVRVSGAPV